MEGVDAQRVFGYALFKEGKDTKVAYPLEGHSADVSDLSFHHGRFQKLRTKASSLPKLISHHALFGLVLEGFSQWASCVAVRLESSSLKSSDAFLCCGHFSLGRLLTVPSPKRLWIGVRLIMETSNIIFPIIKAEGLVRMFFLQMVKDYYKTLEDSVN